MKMLFHTPGGRFRSYRRDYSLSGYRLSDVGAVGAGGSPSSWGAWDRYGLGPFLYKRSNSHSGRFAGDDARVGPVSAADVPMRGSYSSCRGEE